MFPLKVYMQKAKLLFFFLLYRQRRVLKQTTQLGILSYYISGMNLTENITC